MARREFSGGYVVRDASGFVVADVYGRSTDDEATRPFLQTASLQVLPFTTICLKSILAGQLGRFASSLWARTFQICFPKSMSREMATNSVRRMPYASSVKGQTS
jgi:hypothetical protein